MLHCVFAGFTYISFNVYCLCWNCITLPKYNMRVPMYKNMGLQDIINSQSWIRGDDTVFIICSCTQTTHRDASSRVQYSKCAVIKSRSRTSAKGPESRHIGKFLYSKSQSSKGKVKRSRYTKQAQFPNNSKHRVTRKTVR